MRLIDADELKEVVFSKTDGMDDMWDTAGVLNLINNAPTVEPFEPDYVGAERLKARQRGYEEGYHYGLEIGKTLNPKLRQGGKEE